MDKEDAICCQSVRHNLSDLFKAINLNHYFQKFLEVADKQGVLTFSFQTFFFTVDSSGQGIGE